MPTKHLLSESEEDVNMTTPLKRMRHHQGEAGLTFSHNSEPNQSDVQEYETPISKTDLGSQSSKLTDPSSEEHDIGSIREAGAIEMIKLSNFMCHDHFTIQLGPQANFVIGQNGSGKSAILAAIIMVFGGKASDTGRASSSKDLIKNDQTRADLQVRLSNRGDEAYKPEIFGETVIIERFMTRSGGGGYKIRSSNHKLIGTKKEDLQAILDHYMIQAENPLNILKQDDSKEFLRTSTSKDKYKLFKKGTQLGQLEEDYKTIETNLEHTKFLMKNQQESLMTLHAGALVAQSTLKELDTASLSQVEVFARQKELSWAYVKEKQLAKEAHEQDVKQEESLIQKSKEKVKECQTKLLASKTEIENLTKKLSENDDDRREARLDELIDEIKTSSTKIKLITSDIREEKVTKEQLETDLADNKLLVDEENAKVNQRTKMNQDEVIQLQRSYDLDIIKTETRLREVKEETDRSKALNETLHSQAIQLKQDLNKVERVIQAAQRKLTDTKRNQSNRWAPYDKEAKRIQGEIDNSDWERKPMGPLGLHVTLIDMKWSQVVESLLDRSLGAYVVTNEGDQKKLRAIMNKFGCHSPIIRTQDCDFDYSDGIPSSEFVTILSVLAFENEFVKRVLIDQNKIEQTILVNHRLDGEPIMMNPPKNVLRCYTHDASKIGYRKETKTFDPLRLRKGVPRLTKDLEAYICEQEEGIKRSKDEETQLKHQLHMNEDQFKIQKSKQIKLQDLIKSVESNLNELKSKKADLDEEILELGSSNLTALHSIRRNLESDLEKSLDHHQALLKERKEVQDAVKILVLEKEEIEKYFDSKSEVEKRINQELEKLTEQQTTLKANRAHYQANVDKHQNLAEKASLARDQATDEHLTLIENATEFCGSDEVLKIDTSVDELISELKRLEMVIRRIKQRHGNGETLEQIRVRCQDTKVAYKKAEDSLEEMYSLINLLHQALDLRRKRWTNFRTQICSRAKMNFISHLNRRNYTGRLKFSHTEETLEILVDPNTNGELSKSDRNPASGMLSGGERTFSTISLLLTLWESINSPIRCLDEFDVYMDVAHQSVAASMLLESAQRAQGVQCIFITHNEIDTSKFGPETRVLRLADPNRTII